MISKTHRFHGPAGLRFVFQRGRTLRDGDLSLKYTLNNRRRQYRAAVVVSRKVNKSAVVRNHLRRQIYETVRSLETRIDKPYDLIFFVYSEQVGAQPSVQRYARVEKLLAAAGVLNAP